MSVSFRFFYLIILQICLIISFFLIYFNYFLQFSRKMLTFAQKFNETYVVDIRQIQGCGRT